MQTSDALYRLIKSLNKNEKGYFRKMAAALSGAKDSNYMLLFDALDEQDAFNEAAIIERFKGEKFVKQLSVTKNYLFDLILRALRMYNSSNGLSLLNDHVENAQLLYKRLLTDEALDELKAARVLARNQDRQHRLLEIERLERRIQYDVATTGWDEKIKETISSNRKLLERLAVELDITEVHYNFMHFVRHTRMVRTAEQEKLLDDWIKHPALKTDCEQLGFEARIRLNMAFKIYYQLKNEDLKSLEYMRRIEEEYHRHPAVIEDDPKRYLLALNNYLSVCIKLNMPEEIEGCLARVNTELVNKNSAARVMWYDFSSSARIYLFSVRNQTEKALEFAAEVEAGLKEFEPYMSNVRVDVMKYNLMLIYHRADMPGRALDWLNEILNSKGIELRRDMYSSLRIYNLILHYDLKNILLLESAVRSAKNFLQTREMYYELERTVIKYFLKLITSADEPARKKVLLALRAEVEDLTANNTHEKNLLQNIELLSWIDSTVEGIPMKDYMKRKSEVRA